MNGSGNITWVPKMPLLPAPPTPSPSKKFAKPLLLWSTCESHCHGGLAWNSFLLGKRSCHPLMRKPLVLYMQEGGCRPTSRPNVCGMQFSTQRLMLRYLWQCGWGRVLAAICDGEQFMSVGGSLWCISKFSFHGKFCAGKTVMTTLSP